MVNKIEECTTKKNFGTTKFRTMSHCIIVFVSRDIQITLFLYNCALLEGNLSLYMFSISCFKTTLHYIYKIAY
jgi:hypothetical protein